MMAGRILLRRKGPGEPDDLRAALNDEQWAAVSAPLRPTLIIAGAGTGKTHTLTHRLAYMLRSGLAPQRVVLATFTNRAAREMLARCRRLVGSHADLVLGGTFHHVANRVLRKYAEPLGFSPNYNVLDAEDARQLVGQCRQEAGVARADKRFPKRKFVARIISTAANRMLSVVETVTRFFPDAYEFLEDIERIAGRYRLKKRSLSLLDYDDLLTYMLELLRDERLGPPVRRSFDAVLVDEYQDTNALQAAIVDRLAAEHGNLTVVGDDAQSIYAFRGAEFENIIRFPERWPDCNVFHLTLNYRSTPQVLGLTNASIAHNERQFKKELRAFRPDGPSPSVVSCSDVQEQAEFVAQQILDLREEGLSLSEMAVLYRSHWNSLEVQVELLRRRIPYEVRSGLRFFERAHIKDVCAFLRIVANRADELAWRRAAALFQGVGERTAAALFAKVRQTEAPLDRLLSDDLLSGVSSRARPGVRRLLRTLAAVASEEMTKAPDEALRRVLEEAYLDVLKSKHPDWREREADIRQLAAYAATFGDLSEFLAHLAICTSLDAETSLAAAPDFEEEMLTLSTVHRAKGLEWAAVFLIWCAEGALPSPMALDEPGGVEEERRIFYVACTRAKESLFLTYPRIRVHARRWQPDAGFINRPSRFIDELPDATYEEFEVLPSD